MAKLERELSIIHTIDLVPIWLEPLTVRSRHLSFVFEKFESVQIVVESIRVQTLVSFSFGPSLGDTQFSRS